MSREFTLTSLVEYVQEQQDPLPGECVEVHTDETGDICSWSTTTPDAFVTAWGESMGLTCWPIGQFPDFGWIGWVHQTGAILIRLGEPIHA